MRAALPVLLLLAACSSTTTTTKPTPVEPPPKTKPTFSTKPATSMLQIVHIGDSEAGLLADVDTGIGGLARSRAIIDALVARHPSIVLHGGDLLIPAPELSLEVPPPGGGKARSALLTANDLAGVQATALGNHDLDLGEAFLADAVEHAAFSWVASTLQFDGGPLKALVVDDQTPWLQATRGKIVRRGKLCTEALVDQSCKAGVVGVVGASPEDLQVISRGAKNVRAPATVEATRDALQVQIDALRAEGISVVVLLSHRQGVQRDLALIASGLTGVDVIVSGGGENLLASSKHRLRSGAVRDGLCDSLGEPCYPIVRSAKDGDAVVVASTEGDFRAVGALAVSFDDDGRVTGVEASSRPWPVDEESLLELRATVDKSLLKYELSVRDALLPLRRLVGETPVALDGTRELVRNGETNLGSASADSLVVAARVTRPDVKAALRNGGGIRGFITGPHVSVLDLQSALRFDSKVVVVDVTHQDLARTVEAALRGAGTGRGHFPQVSSDVDIVYSSAGADQQQVLDNGKVKAIACDGTRLRSLKIGDTAIVVDGAVVAKDAVIAVATIDYLAGGGDGWFPAQTPKTTATASTEQSALQALLQNPAAMKATLAKTGRIHVVDTAPPAPVCAASTH